MTSVASVSVLEDVASQCFEGAEKLLELQCNETPDSHPLGLRAVKRAVWEEMLDLVNCKVLSVIEGDEVDAYLLSESSMFVWSNKLILKTCGTTTLLYGLQSILRIAKEQCGFKDIYRCFYSRKAFMWPERQQGPHRKWDDEVDFLENTFGKGNGSAYVVGKMNGDHWLLYLTAPKEDVDIPDEPGHDQLIEDVLSTSISPPSASRFPHASSSQQPSPKPPSPPDQTLEILMTQLDPQACEAFYYPPDQLPDGNDDGSQQGHLAGSQLSKRLGIDTLLEGSTLDSFLFTPCGYSANIVKDDRYATIHVTPEVDWSYASFECNFDFRRDQDSLHNLIAQVLSIFRPATMSLTLFVSVEETAAGVDQSVTPETRTILDPKVAEGYKRSDRILYEFAGYHLLYSTYEKR